MPKQRRYASTQKHRFIDGGYVFWAAFFVIYQIFSSIFPLPILLGFFFCYALSLIKESELNLYDLDFRYYFALLYLLFIDITHDFYLFSSWIAFFIFYYFFVDWIRITFKIGKLLPIFFTLCAYLFFYVLDQILSYVDTSRLDLLGKEYFIYALIEAFICFFVFKDKLR